MPSKGKFKYGNGDQVTCTTVPGQWRVYSPSPTKGHYYLAPRDPDAKALASLLPHGMLEAHVREVVLSPPRQQKLKETPDGQVQDHHPGRP